MKLCDTKCVRTLNLCEALSSIFFEFHLRSFVGRNEDKWQRIREEVKEFSRPSNSNSDCKKLDLDNTKLFSYFGHRETLMGFERALHVSPENVIIPRVADFVNMDLFHDEQRGLDCKDGGQETDAICTLFAFAVDITMNGELSLVTDELRKEDCAAAPISCDTDDTKGISLLTLQALVLRDFEEFGSPEEGRNKGSTGS